MVEDRNPGGDRAARAPVYDCLILSGGGSKGAYGAGVAKAIDAYRRLKNRINSTCYVGASAGALNAYMLAAGKPDELIRFWLSATNARILGVNRPDSKFRQFQAGAGKMIGVEPESLYGNEALDAVIRQRARLDRLHSPLIIAATDYTQGIPKAFYASDLIDKLVAFDAALPELRSRRLAHFRRILDDDMLARALLGSSAIPVFFPPVPLNYGEGEDAENSLFIDGGVGNNTPTREAAYFLRYLKKTGSGRKGTAFCVKLERPRIVEDDVGRLGFTDVLKRTLDVYHHVHTRPIITAWKRINHEVRELREKLDAITTWIGELPIKPAIRAQIVERVKADFGAPGGSTPRLDAPLVVVEPSIELGDTLQFDPARARNEILHGYTDALKALAAFVDPRAPDKGPAIDDAEYQELHRRNIFPGKAGR